MTVQIEIVGGFVVVDHTLFGFGRRLQLFSVVFLLNKTDQDRVRSKLALWAVEIFVAVSPSSLLGHVANSALASAPVSNGVTTLPF